MVDFFLDLVFRVKGAEMVWRPQEPEPEIIRKNRRIIREQSEFCKAHGLDMEEAVRFVIEAAGDIVPPVLDVEVGQGLVSLELARMGIKVHAVDTSEEMLQMAFLNARSYRVDKLIEYHIADASDLPFENEYFNLVTMVNVLHHLKDITSVLSEISRVLARGGDLLVADLTEEGFSIIGKINENKGFVHRRETKYSIDDLARILPEFGLYCHERDIRFQHYVMLARKE
jgi:ubiquinone/menaquinone biosynthesis C-methylase UbiE